ncbi:MAG: hypothetical protein ACYTFY_10945 [Planctomycetota bacterium]|jgi:hypothetical protein
MRAFKHRKERGSALVMAMIMSIVAMGMIAATVILTQYSAEETSNQIEYNEALNIAEIGLNHVIQEIKSFEHSAAGGWVEDNLDAGSTDTRTYQGTANGVPFTVQVKSAYLAYQSGTEAGGSNYLKDISTSRASETSEDFEIYELVAVSGQVGKYGQRRGIRAIIEVPKQTLSSTIPSPLYIDNDPFPKFSGNSFLVSGEDHAMEPAQERASIKMPFTGDVQINYEGSAAGLLSSFFMKDPVTNEEIVIFEDNAPGASYPTDTRTFTQGQALNFYARTQGSAWGIGDYDHWTEGSDPYTGKPWAKKFMLDENNKTYLTDGTVAATHMVDGDQNLYDENNNVVEPILVDMNQDLSDYQFQNADGQNVIRVRFGIEDLPGRYQPSWNDSWSTPDWDYDDVVVKLDLVQTVCATCGGKGFLANNCTFCGGDGIKNNGNACNKCDGPTDVVDCPDCNVEKLTEQPWWEMPEDDSLTGAPGKPAIAANPAMVDENGDHDAANPDNNTRERTEDESWDACSVSANQIDQVKCDEIDSAGNHLGFDKAAVDSGEMTISERGLEHGSEAFDHSTLNLRELAAKFVGGTATLLPGETGDDGQTGGSVKTGVNEYTEIGSGSNVNDIGSKDEFKVTYINGDAGTMAGQITGGGVMVINGNAHISGQWAFAGVVIVLGDLKVSGGGNNSMHVLGAVLVGGETELTGKASVWWSKEAVDNVADLTNYPSDYKVNTKVWKAIDSAEIDALGL